MTGPRGIERMRRQGPRFSMVPPAAAFDTRLEALDVRVLMVFGAHIDRQGWCFRSQVKMARELGCGRATLQRAIARLIGAGYLEQRTLEREDGAQGIHEYRVFFDPEDGAPDAEDEAEPQDGGGDADEAAPPAHQRAPLPTSGQGPAHAMERAGPARSMERAAYNDPLNDPSSTDVRERRASEGEEIPDPEGLAAFRRLSPSTIVDDPDQVEAAWRALSAAERKAAVAGTPVLLEARRKAGRTHVLGGASILSKRLWEPALAAAKAAGSAGPSAAVGGLEVAEPWSRRFWACLVWAATVGALPVPDMRRRCSLLLASNIGWPIKGEAMRAGVDEVEASLASTRSDGERAKGWEAFLRERGFDVRDRFAGKPFYVFLPERPPPEPDLHESADELADGL